MSEATPAQIQTLLAAEFDRQGWQYDLTLGPQLLAEVEKRGAVDPAALAATVPAAFLQTNRTTRDNFAAAIERAIGGRIPNRGPEVATLVIENHTYEVNISDQAQVQDSNFNVGKGTQINVAVGGEREGVLAALKVLLRGGFGGDWNEDAAAGLANVIENRDDIAVEDVRALTAEVAEAEQPTPPRARAILEKIATAGLGGAFGTGISAALGHLLANPPF
jgi:hypothetical protein